MVERFNGRIGSEVLGITIYSHRNLEQLLRGFNAAYNVRRQRVLNGKTPGQIIAECLEARPQLSKSKGTSQERAGPCDITKARFIVQARQGGLTTRQLGAESLSAHARLGNDLFPKTARVVPTSEQVRRGVAAQRNPDWFLFPFVGIAAVSRGRRSIRSAFAPVFPSGTDGELPPVAD
jgi:hypothetical protein